MLLKKIFFYLFLIGLATLGSNSYAQNISNEGTDFWTVFPTHDASQGNLATMNVNITSKSDSRVTVTCGAYTETQDIPANIVVTFLIDRSQSYIDYGDGNGIASNRGIHIVVAPGMPKVVAYSHVFASARSAATLILPKESLGQKYYSMNYKQDPGGQNFLALVAVEDNTGLILHKTDGTTVPINLPKAGDVYEYISTTGEDFTGTFVEVDANSSCKRFAAFSGSTSISIICSGSKDPLLQQLYAINSWGKSYGIIPFKDRRYTFRVLAQEDNTVVKLDGNVLTTLNKGRFYESATLTEGAIISADKLISVAQYSLTQNCSGYTGLATVGDPEMVLLNPIEFNIKKITVFSSNKQNITQKFINVFMKTLRTNSFSINGSSPGLFWTPMPGDGTYSYVQIPVTEESLTLTADDGFNAIAYGFGQFESYAYSAGTSLASSQFLVLVNKSSKLENSVACVGQATDFKLTMPYLLTKITWKFGDGVPDFIDVSPTPIITTNVDGNLYTYTSPVNKIFTTVGQSVVAAVVNLATSTNTCVTGELELDFTVDVNALPVPDFTLSSTDLCLGAEVKPIDNSGNVTRWRWQFDNGPFVEEKSPTHIFTTGGNHTIKLWVANDAGCWSDDAKLMNFNISGNKISPRIDFQLPNQLCYNDNKLQLTARETLGLAGTFLYSGTGVSSTGVFDPALAGSGIHDITYTFTSSTGCVNAVTKTIEVLALPIVSAPANVYILAGGQRQITATAQGTNLRYKWSPSAGLSEDDILDPIASPDQDTDYILTVSIDGLCDVVVNVSVRVLDQLSPPNTFSPNGDGINDVWNIKSLDSYPDANIEVFTRTGQKVFISKGYTTPFDGTFQNKALPVGVYYYRISPNNGRKTISGALTIIR